jgi:replicative DNA helicase
MSQQVSPADVDQERDVLACAIEFTASIRLCIEAGLQAQHFYLAKHQAIYSAAERVISEREQADPMGVWATLERIGQAHPSNPEGPDKQYVMGLVGTSVNHLNVGARAKHLIYLADKRAKEAGAKLILEGVGAQDDKEYRRLVQDGIEQIAVDYELDAEPTTPEQIAEYIHAYIESTDDPEVFKLPWADLNKLVLGGYRRGQTSVLAGWTNFGKSIVLDQMLTAFHRQGYRCGLFVTEMSLLERMARRIAASTGVAAEKFLLKQLTTEEKRKVAKAAMPAEVPFSFYDAQGWTYDRIAQRIAIETFDVVAIDPINLIVGFADQEVLTEAAARFQAIARRANCHLIMVAHLNRARAQHAVLPKPVLRDVRDSGMLANNADQVLFLHREQDDEGNVLPEGEIYFDKVRNGMKGGIDVALTARHVQFVKQARIPEEEDADSIAVSRIGASW